MQKAHFIGIIELFYSCFIISQVDKCSSAAKLVLQIIIQNNIKIWGFEVLKKV